MSIQVATIDHGRSFFTRLFAAPRLFIEAVVNGMELKANYEQALAELNSYSDNDLAALGLSRYDIPRIAAETALAATR